MTKKEKRLLIQVKINAFKLKENGQIPPSLYSAILDLNFDSLLDDVTKLMGLSERYLRVKGYYFKHSYENESCVRDLKTLGF